MRALTTLFTAALLLLATTPYAQPPVVWQRLLEGPDAGQVYASCPAADGGQMLAVGRYSFDYTHATLAKLTATGDVVWERLYGWGSDDLVDVAPTPDGNYFAVGWSESWTAEHQGFYDGWVVKFDEEGDVLWQRLLGSAHDEVFGRVVPLADNGCVVFGNNTGNGGDVVGAHSDVGDIWMVRLDADGAIQWQRSFGGSEYERVMSAIATPDGGFLVAGTTQLPIGDPPSSELGYFAWVFKVDADGEIEWQRILGGSCTFIGGLAQHADGSYTAVGTTCDADAAPWDVNVYAIHLSATGETLWESELGGSGGESARAVVPAGDGCILAATTNSNDGAVSGNNGEGDIWLVRLDGDGQLVWQMTLGGPQEDVALSLRALADGGYLVTGQYSPAGQWTNGAGWVVRLGDDANSVAEQQQIQLHIGPNPAHAGVRITLQRPVAQATVTLFDGSGREVLRQPMNATSTTLQVADLARGFYLVSVRSTEGLWSERLVLE